MDKPKTTPRDFFLWAGAMIALYTSVFAYISLVFDYINYAYPDTLQYNSGDPYSSSVSYEMASLIVLVPVFLALMAFIRRSIVRDTTRADIWVRRWALYLTLFVAGATMVGDLITLIMYFLNGDVTVRFLLKVVVLLLVMGGGFLHFLADMQGYWARETKKARMVGWATGALVLLTIVGGFFILGTPWQARLYRYDDQKVNDLQSIQYQVVNYWQSKEKLPVALSDLNDPIANYTVPTDPQAGDSYTYKVTGALSFQLCATFNAETQPYSPSTRTAPMLPTSVGEVGKPVQDTWQHSAGNQCFDRTIDPQRYPPFSKTKTQ